MGAARSRAVWNPPHTYEGVPTVPPNHPLGSFTVSNEIKSAIRATIKALRTKVTSGNTDPGYKQLVEQAIAAAERVVGSDEVAAQATRRRYR